MPLKFTLQQTMDQWDITQTDLHRASGIRMNTIKDIREGKPKALTVNAIDRILYAINEMTGVKYGLEAIMIYEDGE